MISARRVAMDLILKNTRLRDRHFHQTIPRFIKIGDKIPSVDLFEGVPDQVVNIAKLCEGKTIILFGVPGAFTPGCSKTHLPGYIERSVEFKEKGVHEVVCVSVNDPYVMAAWGEDHCAKGKVRLLADPQAEFAQAVDLIVCLAPLGGIRSKRYSMKIENGVIKRLHVEPNDGTGLSNSLAEKMD